MCLKCASIMSGMKINYILSKGKNIRLEVTATGEVNVRYPAGVSRQKVDAFVREKHDWLEKKVEEAKRNVNKNGDIFDLKTLILLGKRVKIDFFDIKRAFITSETLVLPQNIKNKPDQIRAAIKNFVTKFARELLPQCVAHFSEIIGKCPAKIAISHPKSIWGSCNANKTIRLNAKLVMLPKHLMEYVVIHELCHLSEMNHSAEFWALVNRFCDSKRCRAELKNYNYLITLF